MEESGRRCWDYAESIWAAMGAEVSRLKAAGPNAKGRFELLPILQAGDAEVRRLVQVEPRDEAVIADAAKLARDTLASVLEEIRPGILR